MDKRIKKIRADFGVTQEKFAERIGLTRNYINLIETGRRVPADRTISDICRIYGVNEEWLKNGIGEPYVSLSKTQQIGEFVNEVMAEVDDSFKKRFILALSKLNAQDWDSLQKLVEEIIRG